VADLNKMEAIVQEFAGVDDPLPPDRQAVVNGGTDTDTTKQAWIDGPHWVGKVLQDTDDVPTGFDYTLTLNFYYPNVTSGGNSAYDSGDGWAIQTKVPSYKFFMGYSPNPWFDDQAGAYQKWLQRPLAILAEITRSPYENDQVSGRSLFAGGEAVNDVLNLMKDWKVTFTNWSKEIAVTGSDLQGSAAGLMKEQLEYFAAQMGSIADKLDGNGVPQAINNAAAQLNKTVQKLFDDISNWQMLTSNTPQAAMSSLWFDKVVNPMLGGLYWAPPDWGAFKASNYTMSPVGAKPADPHPYGDPTTQGFWDALAAAAKTNWLANVGKLDTTLTAELPALATAYTTATATFPDHFPSPPAVTPPGSGSGSGSGSGGTSQADIDKEIAQIEKDDQAKLDAANAEAAKQQQQMQDEYNKEIDDLKKQLTDQQQQAQDAAQKAAEEAAKQLQDEQNQAAAQLEAAQQQAQQAQNDAQKQAQAQQEQSQQQLDDVQAEAQKQLQAEQQQAQGATGATSVGGDQAGQQALASQGIGENSNGDLTVPAGSTVTSSGQVLGPNGQVLTDANGNPITVPAGSTVGSDGTITTPSGQTVDSTGVAGLGSSTGTGASGVGIKSVNPTTGSSGSEDVVGPNGQLVKGSDGNPITVPAGSTINSDGTITGPNGQLVTGANGQTVTVPNGSSLVPTTTVTGADGQVVTDSHGSPVTVPDTSTVNPDGTVTGPGGQILTGSNGQPINVGTGATLTNPVGAAGTASAGGGTGTEELVNSSGQPILGSNGQPVVVPDGSSISGGHIVGANGKVVTNADGSALTVPSGSSLVPTTTVTSPDGQTVTDASGNAVTVPDTSTISNGQVLDSSGQALTGAGGAKVTVPAGSTVNPDGTISTGAGQTLTNASGHPITVPAGSTAGVTSGASSGASSGGSASHLITPSFKSSALNGSHGLSGSTAGVAGGGASGGIGGGGGGLGGGGLGGSGGAGTKLPSNSVSEPKAGTESASSGEDGLQAAEVAAEEGQMMSRVATTGGGATGSEGQMMPPMSGGGGGGGGAGSQGNRKTWVTEDEDVWGTESETTAGVLGR